MLDACSGTYGLRYTHRYKQHNPKDSGHGDKQPTAEQSNQSDLLRPRHSSLPKHGHRNHDEVKVSCQVESETSPYQSRRNGSMAESSRVREDLPPVVEGATTEKKVHLHNNKRRNDEAKADDDPNPVALKVFCKSIVESAHGCFEDPEEG
jgi:hypothetical protein